MNFTFPLIAGTILIAIGTMIDSTPSTLTGLYLWLVHSGAINF